MNEKKISIRIDGELVPTFEGQTILQAARSANKFIPTLCYLAGLSPVGACRMCIVEVAGVGRLLPACTTPVQDGMSVTTQSQKLTRYRRIAIELLFAERNHVCAACVSNGHCELQAMARHLGVTSIRYPYNFPRLTVDMSHPRYVLDHNRCILCTRCVRACGELEGAHVWSIASRGIQSRVVAELNGRWADASTCTSCGKCVQACPTGALVEKGFAVEEMTKKNENIATIAARKGVTTA